MENYKILEQNGIDNENIDGGAFNNFTANGKSGIILDVLDECKVLSEGNNIIITSGLLLIKGIRIKIKASKSFSLVGNPATDMQYYLVAKVVLNTDKSILFNMFLTTEQTRVQENLYKTNSGTYELEIAKFIYSTDAKIKNLTRTAEIIRHISSDSNNSGGISQELIDKINGKVSSATDKTSGAYVYVRLNGQDSVLARKAYDGSGSSLTGVIPMYVDYNKLRGGEPVNAYDYVNLNYFNNNNTLLFKLTLEGGTFTIRKQVENGEVEETLNLLDDATINLYTTIEPIVDIDEDGIESIDFLTLLKSGLFQQYGYMNELIINGTYSDTFSNGYLEATSYCIGRDKFSGPPIFSIKWSGGVYSIEKL